MQSNIRNFQKISKKEPEKKNLIQKFITLARFYITSPNHQILFKQNTINPF